MENLNKEERTLHDRVSRLETQTRALSLDCSRPTSLQQPGLSHKTLSDCANKCQYPCNWNQNQQNATQESVIAIYEIDQWGLIKVKDTLSEFSFLVDTGAMRSLFPRQELPKYPERIKDENFYITAADGTKIATYGPIHVCLNLGCKWQFDWQFVIADVASPIIGMDFMQHHGFLVDTRNKCLFKPKEPSYEILCHGCHWGMNAPHKPNPVTFSQISHLTPSSGSGRGRLRSDAKQHCSATPGGVPEAGKKESKVMEQ